jgi:hypothetical protein
MSIIIVIALFYAKAFGLILNVIAIAIFAIITATLVFIKQYPPAVINTQRE